MGQMISRVLSLCCSDQADAVTPIAPTPMVCHCLCSLPSGAEAASSFFYSKRIAELSEQRSKFDNQLDFDVESSTSHWTSVTAASVRSDESDEQVPNNVVFEKLKEHPEWGPFFRRHPYELEIGAKIAEGGQAEIYEALGMNKDDRRCEGNKKVRLVLKVFKEGFSLDQLHRMWPPGMASAMIPHIYFPPLSNAPFARRQNMICWALGAHLLDDGRFAYIFDRHWGDLRKLIDENMLKRNGCPPFSARTTYMVILSIAQSMRDLHKLGILHNDLKAANALVKDPEQVWAFVEVADFETSMGIEGTGFWRAPELLLALKNRKLQQETFVQQTSQQTDVYNFAMTCYEIITGHMPFEGRDVQDYDIILRGERPILPSSPCFSSYNNLVMKCWDQDPRQRPSFVEVVTDLKKLDYRGWPKNTPVSATSCGYRWGWEPSCPIGWVWVIGRANRTDGPGRLSNMTTLDGSELSRNMDGSGTSTRWKPSFPLYPQALTH